MERNTKLDTMLLSSAFYGMVFMVIFIMGAYGNDMAMLKISVAVYGILLLNILLGWFFIDTERRAPAIVILLSFILVIPLVIITYLKVTIDKLFTREGGDNYD